MKETIPNAFTIDKVCRGNNTIEEKGGLNISYFSKRGGVCAVSDKCKWW